MCNNQNCGCESDCEDNCQCKALNTKPEEKIEEPKKEDSFKYLSFVH